jgi:hypothetical protein
VLKVQGSFGLLRLAGWRLPLPSVTLERLLSPANLLANSITPCNTATSFEQVFATYFEAECKHVNVIHGVEVCADS